MLSKNKYNWNFYFKMTVAILPLMAIIVYMFGNAADVMRDPNEYWTGMLDGREEKFIDGFLASLQSWTSGDVVAYAAVRNLLLITTLGNVFAAAWFINSAMNNDKEGQGKFDNYFWGIIVLTLIWWISILYNMSLIVSGALKTMKWYTYVSWIFEHSLVQFAMLIYFIVFYKKYNVTKGKRNIVILWAYAQLPQVAYMLVFTAIGMIAKAADGFQFFGDMSSDGHFPYDFYDFTNDNTRVNFPNMSPQVQYPMAFFGFIAFNSIWIFMSYFKSLKQSEELNLEQK